MSQISTAMFAPHRDTSDGEDDIEIVNVDYVDDPEDVQVVALTLDDDDGVNDDNVSTNMSLLFIMYRQNSRRYTRAPTTRGHTLAQLGQTATSSNTTLNLRVLHNAIHQAVLQQRTLP